MMSNRNPQSAIQNPKLYTCHSPEETTRFGVQLGRQLFPGALIALSGELGSGKTCLVQGIALGLDIPAEVYVTSPTYTLVNEYHGRLTLFHIDVYRLEGATELEDIGFSDILAADGVTVIEWAEKVLDGLPQERLSILLSILDDRSRSLAITGYGQKYRNMINALTPSRSRRRFHKH
ncbi:MAG: tRNA (adenosine(37)-N6)-threonylcarbamoyltransferase complex ATPase subunit type 1 TsaE [Pseudomonadota bacterium]